MKTQRTAISVQSGLQSHADRQTIVPTSVRADPDYKLISGGEAREPDQPMRIWVKMAAGESSRPELWAVGCGGRSLQGQGMSVGIQPCDAEHLPPNLSFFGGCVQRDSL